MSNVNTDQLRSSVQALLARREPHQRAAQAIRAALPNGSAPTEQQARELREAAQAITGIDAELNPLLAELAAAELDERREGRAAALRRELRGDVDVEPGDVVRRGQRFVDHPLVVRQIGEQQARRQTAPGEQLRMGRYLRGIATGDWTDAGLEQRAMSEGTLGSGGYTVPVDLAAQVIDRARNVGAVFPAGASVVPMEHQKLTIARLTGDPTASFRLENALITASDATFDAITLKARSLAALTVVSRELLEDSANIDSVLEEAFAAQFALAVDRAALYGTGVDPEPLGLRNTAGVSAVAMGANGATPTSYGPLIDARFTVEDNNERATGYIYSSRTGRTLAKLSDTSGQPLTPPPAVAQLEAFTSNQVRNDLSQGTANNASEIYMGDWSQLLVGLRTSFTLEILRERYAEFGQLAFLAHWRGDVAVARPKAFAIVQGILP